MSLMQVGKIWGRSHLLSPFTNLPAGWTLPWVPEVTLRQVISPLTLGEAIPKTLFCILFMQINTRHLAVGWSPASGFPTSSQCIALYSASWGGDSFPRTSPKSPRVTFWVLSPCWHGVCTPSKGPQHWPQLLGGHSLSPTLGNRHHLLATRILGGELNKDAHCYWQNNDSLSLF